MAGLPAAGGYFLVTLEMADTVYDVAFVLRLPEGWPALTSEPVATRALDRQWFEASEHLPMRVSFSSTVSSPLGFGGDEPIGRRRSGQVIPVTAGARWLIVANIACSGGERSCKLGI